MGINKLGGRGAGFSLMMDKSTCFQLLCLVPLLTLIIFYWSQTAILEWEGLFGYGEVQDYGLPGAVMEQFRLFDSNADGCIDPYEFSLLKHHLDVVSMYNDVVER